MASVYVQATMGKVEVEERGEGGSHNNHDML